MHYSAVSACALTSAGQLWCWGYNAYGQVGNATVTQQNAPVSIYPNGIIDIEGAGGNGGSFCALKSDSTMACWGYNPYGALGIGNTTNQNTPQPLFLLTKVAKMASIGHQDSYVRRCVTLSNGDMYCWGYNGY